MATVPDAPPRLGHIPRHQAAPTLLSQRHHRRAELPHIRWYGADVFCKVRSTLLPPPNPGKASQAKGSRCRVGLVCNLTLSKNRSILPALAFILDMNRRTGGFYGVNEALFSSALACMVFSTLGAQPLTIVGITGLISLFNYTIFDIIKRHDVGLYPQFMSWVAIWAAIFHWIFAVFNFCDYMRYVTDFSSQAFGAYVGVIYCSKCSCYIYFPSSSFSRFYLI